MAEEAAKHPEPIEVWATDEDRLGLRKWLLMRVLTVTCWAAERLVEPEARRRLKEHDLAR